MPTSLRSLVRALTTTPAFARGGVVTLTLLLLTGAARPVLVRAQTTAAPTTVVYELRTYTAAPGKQPNVLARFRDHTTRLFTKHGMVNIGYFTPMDSADGAGTTLVYVLRHQSRDAAASSWKAFGADTVWKRVAAESEVNGPIVAKITSVFMSATDFSPEMFSAPRDGGRVSELRTTTSPDGVHNDLAMPRNGARVFELRSYTTPPGLLGNLDSRFRDHTLRIFATHGMQNIAYWHPTDTKDGSGTSLIYLLGHVSRTAATAGWAAFRADSTWLGARAASEKAAGGSLTTVVKSVFLVPTDFSTLR